MAHTSSVIFVAVHANFRAVATTFFCLLVACFALAVCAFPTFTVIYDINVYHPLAVALSQLQPGTQQLTLIATGLTMVMCVGVMKHNQPPFWPFDTEVGKQYRLLRHWNRWMIKLSAAIWLLALALYFIGP